WPPAAAGRSTVGRARPRRSAGTPAARARTAGARPAVAMRRAPPARSSARARRWSSARARPAVRRAQARARSRRRRRTRPATTPRTTTAESSLTLLLDRLGPARCRPSAIGDAAMERPHPDPAAVVEQLHAQLVATGHHILAE